MKTEREIREQFVTMNTYSNRRSARCRGFVEALGWVLQKSQRSEQSPREAGA